MIATGAPAVRVERSGPVTTVILDRPQARNAVDGPAAEALAGAFRNLDSDTEVSVAVLWGTNGTFCSGADLKAIDTDARNRLHPVGEGDGPMGPTRLAHGREALEHVQPGLDAFRSGAGRHGHDA